MRFVNAHDSDPDPKLPQNQTVKRILKYLKGMAMQGLIMKPYIEKGIECYVDDDSVGGWSQEEGKDIGLGLSIMGYVITYANYPIIWASRIQTKIAFSTTEVEYIDISQVTRDVLPFVSLMK